MKNTISKLMTMILLIHLSFAPSALAQALPPQDPRAEDLSEPMDVSFEEVHITRAPAEPAPYVVVLESEGSHLDPEAQRESQLSQQEFFLFQVENHLGRRPDLLERDVVERNSLTLNLLKAEARALVHMDGVLNITPLESSQWPSAGLSAQVDESLDINTREVPLPVTLQVSQSLANAGSTLIYTLTIPVNRTGADLVYDIQDTLPEGSTFIPGSLRTNGSDILAAYDDLTNTIYWSGIIPNFELRYDVSDNRTNPTYCKMPLFDGGYIDIYTRYETPTNPGVYGDGIAFTLGALGTSTEYFGEVIPYRPRFTDDGYVLMNTEQADTYTAYEINQVLPYPDEPNGLLSLWWRDMFISYDEASNKGVTAKYFADAWLVEFDDIEGYWNDLTLDFEVFTWQTPDPEIGWPDIIFAYDNVEAGWDAVGSIGIENADGTQGYSYAYDSYVPQSGDIICFDYFEVGKDPVIITFAVSVDVELRPGTVITNTVAYTVDGGLSEASSAAFMVNDTPVAYAQILVTDEDVPLSIQLAGSDTYPGGDLAFKITQPPNGTALADGALPNLIYTPKLDFFGTDSFTFTVADELATSEPATITIEVLPVNDLPVIGNIPDQTLEEGQSFAPIDLNPYITDVETPDSKILWTYAGNHNLLVTINTDKSAVVSPSNPHWYGTETITFRATDLDGAYVEDSATFTMTPVNDAPVGINDIAGTTPNSPLEITTSQLLANDWDVDGDDLIVIAVSNPIHGEVIKVDETITFTPEEDFIGTGSFDYTISDGELEDTAHVTVEVNTDNNSPKIIEGDSLNVTMSEDGVPIAFSLTLHAGDANGDILTWDIATPATHGTASATGEGYVKEIGYSPNPNYFGSDSFVVQVSDGNSGVDTITVNVTIDAVNDPPIITGQESTLTIPEENLLEITFSELIITDVDNPNYPIGFTLTVFGGSNYTVLGNTVKPFINFNGTLTVPVMVNDGEDNSNIFSLAITVTPVNDAPVAWPQTVSTTSNTPVQITLVGTDVDQDELSDYIITLDPLYGTLSGTAPNLTFTPNLNFYGLDYFTFTVDDGLATSEPASITIQVLSPPVVSDIPGQTVVVGESFTPISLNNFVTDPDNDLDEINWSVSGKINLMVSIDDHIATITPLDEDWTGSEILTFTATDPNDLWDSDMATFEILPDDSLEWTIFLPLITR